MTWRPLAPDLARWHGQALPDPGTRAELKWLAIDKLVIDPAYQRPITVAGRKNIDQIVKRFSWSQFAPVIVAPVTCADFAIIDGQHRTTAAAERGFKQVPCMIVPLLREAQAAAFAAINGRVTPIHPLMLYKAARTAGEKWAIEIDEICAAAGVTIASTPKVFRLLTKGETLAVGTIRNMIVTQGRAHAMAVLTVLARSKHNEPGAICANSIRALAEIFMLNAAWRSDLPRATRVLDQIILPERGLRSMYKSSIVAAIEPSFRRQLAAAPKAGEHNLDEAIADLHERGNSVSSIAARLRCKYADVMTSLEKQGLKRRLPT